MLCTNSSFKLFNFISGIIPSEQKIWIIGDEFMSQSFEEHLYQTERYAAIQFELFGYYNNKYTSANPNMVSRIRNQMVRAVKENILLPKFIVVVLDENLIKYMNYYEFGVLEAFGRLINHIMVIMLVMLKSRLSQISLTS